MDVQEFTESVGNALEGAREVLGRIEMEVRQTGEVPDLMAASRLYAQFCLHARDYLTHASLGRPQPRRLAQRVRELVVELQVYTESLKRVAEALPPADLARLVDEAEHASAAP